MCRVYVRLPTSAGFMWPRPAIFNRPQRWRVACLRIRPFAVFQLSLDWVRLTSVTPLAVVLFFVGRLQGNATEMSVPTFAPCGGTCAACKALNLAREPCLNAKAAHFCNPQDRMMAIPILPAILLDLKHYATKSMSV